MGVMRATVVADVVFDVDITVVDHVNPVMDAIDAHAVMDAT